MSTSGAKLNFHNHRTFASFLASDDELLIFRRFDALNARNLLHLQSELLHLEAQLRELDEEDVKDGGMDVMLASRCWETLESRAAEDQPREAERMDLMRRIEKTTYRYNKALAVRSEVLKIRGPGERVWGVFSNWFRQNKPFIGHSKDLLSSKNDFVALKPSMDRDALSSILEYITGLCIACFNANSNPSREPTYYSARIVERIVSAISIIGATLFLEIAIVALYLVSNDHIRLGLIAVFTALFAATLSALSNARRAEMFAATAAYAAVLVVFLSGNLSSGDNSVS